MMRRYKKQAVRNANQHNSITIIGCTCDPESGSKKDFKKFFEAEAKKGGKKKKAFKGFNANLVDVSAVTSSVHV